MCVAFKFVYLLEYIEFNSWMEALDRRSLAKQRADGVMFPKKSRVEGSPSESVPPSGAPGWAIDKDWHLTSQDTGNGESSD